MRDGVLPRNWETIGLSDVRCSYGRMLNAYIYHIKSAVLYIILIIWLICPRELPGQFYFGIKGGYSIPFAQPLELRYDDANDFFIYQVTFMDQDVSPVIAAVGYYRDDIIYFQSEIQYKSVKTTFLADNFIDLDNITQEEQTKLTRNIDIPLIAGIRIDRFKLGVGPNFSFILSENEIFQDIEFFTEQRSRLEMGFGFHVGVLLYRLHLDLSYQYRFNQAGDYLYWRDTPQSFGQNIRFLDLGLTLMF